MLNRKESARFPFKTFLVPILVPKQKWLWPNSAHNTYAWHALLLWHMCVHIYIYMYIT